MGKTDRENSNRKIKLDILNQTRESELIPRLTVFHEKNDRNTTKNEMQKEEEEQEE